MKIKNNVYVAEYNTQKFVIYVYIFADIYTYKY